MDVISDRNCRVCLSQCETRDLDVAQFASKYLVCTGFDINENDIPKKICSTCTSELISASNFQAKCEETEAILENLQLEKMNHTTEALDMSFGEVENVLFEVKDVSATLSHEISQDCTDIINERTNDDTEEYEQKLRLNCDFCEFEVGSCKRIYHLKTHVKKCHADLVTELKCSRCTMTFQLQSLLDFHMKEYHNENGIKDHFTCTFCSLYSLRSETIQSHVLSRHKDAPLFTCIICQKHFRTMDHLRLHIKDTLCGNNILVDIENDFECAIKCDFCSFSCALEANMKYHVEKMHLNAQNSRCVCGSANIYSKDLVTEHLKYKCNLEHPCKVETNITNIVATKRKSRHTQEIDGLTTEERKRTRQLEIVECEFCHDKMRRASLQRHITNIHRGIKYICQHCDRPYTLQSNLKIHIAKHHMNLQTEYPCKYCERKFNAWASRYYHEIRVHTKNFKYNCTKCKKYFIHLAEYDDHMSTHTGTKIRECIECHEMFPTRDSLRTHKETVHRVEPPLECLLCSKTFIREKQLRKHIKQVHGETTNEFPKNKRSSEKDKEFEEYEEAERYLVDYVVKEEEMLD